MSKKNTVVRRDTLNAQIMKALSDDLLRPHLRQEKKMRMVQSKTYGHCLTAARAWYVLSGMPSKAKLIQYKFPDGRKHWFIRHKDKTIDLTREQLKWYSKIPRYSTKDKRFKQVIWAADPRAKKYTFGGKEMRLGLQDAKLIQKILKQQNNNGRKQKQRKFLIKK